MNGSAIRTKERSFAFWLIRKYTSEKVNPKVAKGNLAFAKMARIVKEGKEKLRRNKDSHSSQNEMSPLSIPLLSLSEACLESEILKERIGLSCVVGERKR